MNTPAVTVVLFLLLLVPLGVTLLEPPSQPSWLTALIVAVRTCLVGTAAVLVVVTVPLLAGSDGDTIEGATAWSFAFALGVLATAFTAERRLDAADRAAATTASFGSGGMTP